MKNFLGELLPRIARVCLIPLRLKEQANDRDTQEQKSGKEGDETLRGGNDFRSGTIGASSTLTLGVSFASSTFANSYCCVKTSNTVS